MSWIAHEVLSLKKQAYLQFQAGHFTQAQLLYEKSLDHLPKVRSLGPTNSNIYKIFQECHLNLALTLANQNLHSDSIACLTSLLRYDS